MHSISDDVIDLTGFSQQNFEIINSQYNVLINKNYFKNWYKITSEPTAAIHP
jgi:hypothetical protein